MGLEQEDKHKIWLLVLGNLASGLWTNKITSLYCNSKQLVYEREHDVYGLFESDYSEKQKHLGKHIVLIDGFYLELFHLQNQLCVNILVCLVQHLTVTAGLLGLCASLSEPWATEAFARICDFD